MSLEEVQSEKKGAAMREPEVGVICLKGGRRGQEPRKVRDSKPGKGKNVDCPWSLRKKSSSANTSILAPGDSFQVLICRAIK